MATRKKPTSQKSKLEKKFLENWRSISSIELKEQVPCVDILSFAKGTEPPDWVFDFVSKEARLIIEVNGGTYRGRNGGHSSGQGIKKGYFKSACAQSQQWFFIELDNSMIDDLDWLTFIHKAGCGLLCPASPKDCISYGNNKRKVNQYNAAEDALIAFINADNKMPKVGDLMFLSSKMMARLLPYKKGRSKLAVTQVRQVLEDVGAYKGTYRVSGTKRVAWFHTQETIKLHRKYAQ